MTEAEYVEKYKRWKLDHINNFMHAFIVKEENINLRLYREKILPLWPYILQAAADIAESFETAEAKILFAISNDDLSMIFPKKVRNF